MARETGALATKDSTRARMRPPLVARFSIARTGPSPLQTELVLVFTSPTQLPASIMGTTLLSIALASSSSLQTEFSFVFTGPAQAHNLAHSP